MAAQPRSLTGCGVGEALVPEEPLSAEEVLARLGRAGDPPARGAEAAGDVAPQFVFAEVDFSELEMRVVAEELLLAQGTCTFVF